jgi:hypothetical protein
VYPIFMRASSICWSSFLGSHETLLIPFSTIALPPFFLACHKIGIRKFIK